MIGQDLLVLFQLAGQDFVAGRVLEVETDQLLLSRHHAQLDGGGDGGIALQRGDDAVRGQQAFQRRGGFIVAHHRQQGGPAAQAGDIARHIGGAAGTLLYALDLGHRHRASGEIRVASPNQ